MQGNSIGIKLGTSSLQGVFLVVFSVMCFSIMDAMTKWLIDTYSAYQIVFIRAVLCVVLCFGYAVFTGGINLFLSNAVGLQILRGVLTFSSMILAVLAIESMPLGDAITIIYAAPILVSVLAIPFLGETMGWPRFIAVLIGFAGVIIVVRPGDGFLQTGSLYAVSSMILYAFMVMTTRKLGQRERAVTTMFYTQFVFLLAGGGMALPNWVGPDMSGWGLLLLAGAAGALGQLAMIRAYQMAPAVLLSPFDYSAILWAMIFGFIIFGEIPEVTTILGVALIIGAGLFIIYREARAIGHRK